MKYIIPFLFLLLSTLPNVQAQAKLDSLINILNSAQDDSTQVNTYLNIGQLLEKTNLDSAMVYFNKALNLSEKNGLLEKEAEVLIKTGVAYFNNGDANRVFDYYYKAISIYKKTNNKIITPTYYMLGYYYAMSDRTTEALEVFKKGLEFAMDYNDEFYMVKFYNGIGLMYYYLGLYDKANENHFLGLEIAERTNHKDLVNLYLNIALNYAQENNYTKSLEHNKKSLQIYIKKGNKFYTARTYKNIGDNYNNLKQLDSAKIYYDKALTIYKELNDLESIARCYMVIGINTQESGDLDKAASYYQLVQETLPKEGSKNLRFALYSNLTELNFTLADSLKSDKDKYLNKTINLGKKMEKIALWSESISMETDTYWILYKGYSEKGNLREALKYAKKYITAKDSLFSEQKQETIANMQTKYETEKKRLEIEVLNNKNELISTRLTKSDALQQKQMTIIYILIVSFLMASIFIVIIYRYYLQTKKTNQKLIEQNAIILKQKEEKELLVREIHHRVKNNLQIISSLFHLQMRGTDNSETKAALIDGLNRVKSVGLIHQLLYQNDDVINIKFEDFVNKLVNHIISFSSDKPIEQSLNIPKELYFDIETTLPLGLIITELLTNAFKYAFNEVDICSISINFEVIEDKRYKLEISDNGSGLPKEFDFNTSKSLGLRLVRTLSKQLSGKIEYKYENGAKFLLIFSKRVPHE